MLSLLVLSTLHFNGFGVGVVALGRHQRLNILTGIGNDASKVREYETPCKDTEGYAEAEKVGRVVEGVGSNRQIPQPAGLDRATLGQRGNGRNHYFGAEYIPI